MQEGTGNTQTCNEHKNGANVFLLRKITHPLMHEVCVDFSPILINSGQCFLEYSTLPKFNQDKKYFTPSFILQIDKSKIEENSELCLMNHLRKVEQLEKEKVEIFVPKPSKGNCFCLICKESFEDYLTHVNMPSHLRLLKMSEFYNEIKNLCATRYHKSEPICAKEKKIAKSKKRKSAELPKETLSLKTRKSIETSSTGLHSSLQNIQALH